MHGALGVEIERVPYDTGSSTTRIRPDGDEGGDLEHRTSCLDAERKDLGFPERVRGRGWSVYHL